MITVLWGSHTLEYNKTWNTTRLSKFLFSSDVLFSEEPHLVVTRCSTITVTLEFLRCYNKTILLYRKRLAFLCWKKMKSAIWKAILTELCGLHWLIYLIRILASQSEPISIHFLIYTICLCHKKGFSLIPATMESAIEKKLTFSLSHQKFGKWVLLF